MQTTAIRALALVAITCLAPDTTAQKEYSSPKGFLSLEGNTTFYLSTADRRYQNIDATHLGQAIVIRSLAMRRDGYARQAPLADTPDVTLKLGEGVSMAHLYGTLDRNFHGKPTTVFQKNKMSFPDWNQRPATPPAPFTFVMPFNSTFVYTGLRPFVWDLTLRNGTQIHLTDRVYRSSSDYTAKEVGGGCSGFTHKSRMTNAGLGAKNFGMQLTFSASGGPTHAPSLLSLDIKQSTVTVPGWCGKVHVLPTVLLPLGQTNAGGNLVVQGLAAPFVKAMEGATLYTQIASATANGLSLSSAWRTSMPKQYEWDGHDAAYLYHPLSQSECNFILYGGAFVARLSSQ